MLRDWIALARPKHWIKNVFVLMPVPFALAAGAELTLGRFTAGLFAISLASSAVYALNDAQDAQSDRLHKTKRHRPVAAERISVMAARFAAGALAALAIGIAALGAGPVPAFITSLYLAVNVGYSFGAKSVPLVDVFILAAGFLLRVLLGCALLAVTPSSWLLLCSSGLALFLALAKRRGDLAERAPGEYRPVLQSYNLAFLDQAMTIASALTLIAYAVYSMESEVLVPGREFASLPFVAFGVLEYLRRATVDGEGAEPTETIFSSVPLMVCGAGWAAAVLWSLRLP